MKRTALALAAAVAGALPMSGATAAGAGALAISQASPTIPNFAVADVLYDPAGFAIRGTISRGHTYAAFGTIAGNQLAVSTSLDGVAWTAPRGAMLTRPGGRQLPFTVGSATRLAVTYVPSNVLPHSNRFIIVFAPPGGDPYTATEDLVWFYPRVDNLQYALSADGLEWVEDGNDGIRNNELEPLIDGSASFKAGTLGPSDLVYNPGGDCYGTATANEVDWGSGSPFDCEFTLIYTTIDDAGNTSINAAGGIFFVDIGLEMRATAQPILTRAAATWSSAGIDRAHVRETSDGFEMGFSGSAVSQRCEVVADACSAGTATSGSGIAFAAEMPATPTIANSTAASIAGAAVSVHDLQPTGDDPQRPRWPVTFAGGMWIAQRPFEFATDAPRVLFLEPAGGYISAVEPAITVVVNDDVGATPGIDPNQIDVRIDDAPAVPFTLTETMIGQTNGEPGWLISMDQRQLGLLDGVQTLTVRATDLDGEQTTATRAILVDTAAPQSRITDSTTTGFTFPLNGVYVEGVAQDLGPATGIVRLRGSVRNPLGQVKTFEEGIGGTADVDAGFSFRNAADPAPNGGPRSLDYGWAVPADDPLFWAIPGTYTITVTAIDAAGNVEQAGPANTESLLLI